MTVVVYRVSRAFCRFKGSGVITGVPILSWGSMDTRLANKCAAIRELSEILLLDCKINSQTKHMHSHSDHSDGTELRN